MNNITVNNYIETILNPKGRFKTLEIKAKLDRDNNPILYTKGGIVSFAVSIANTDYLIKCFTNTNIISYSRAKLIAQHTHIKQYRNLISYQYIYREMLVFNSAGEYNYVDIILEEVPKGDNLISKLEELRETNDYVTAEIIFKNIINMFNWMHEFGIAHNNITPQNIIIESNLNPILVNYDLAVKHKSYSDFQAMATIGIIYFTSLCTKEQQYSIKNNYKESCRKIIDTIANTTLESGLYQLKELSKSVIDSNSDIQNWNYIHQILINVSTNLKRYKSLELAFESTLTNSTETKVDIRDKYDFIGTLSDNMIRVERDNKWQFIDSNGNIVISSSFDMAYDFIEGRAAVSIGDKWGLINQNGEFVIPPIYDDLTWDGDANITIVSDNGVMGLISRTGKIIAPFIYDSIHTCSDGCLLAQTDYFYGYLKPNGSVAIEFKYDIASSFSDGIAMVQMGDDKFLIDIHGERI